MKLNIGSTLYGSLLILSILPNSALANYYCSGTVSYLGIDENGSVTIALAGVTKIHKLCSMNIQGGYTIVPTACKAMYGTLLTAKITAAPVRLYYHENGYSCQTIPEWNEIPQTYFVELPTAI